MNPAEIYDEYAINFPGVWPTFRDGWVYVHDGQVAKVDIIAGLLSRHIAAGQVIVLVHSTPGIGAILPKERAADFIASHVRDGDIQAADPSFTSFVEVSTVGVATGWTENAGKPDGRVT